MKSKIHSATLFLLALAGTVYTVHAQDANTIVGKMDQVLYAPADMTGNHTIILIDKNGKQESRQATIMQKGTDKRLMRFTAPSSQAGIAVLALPDDVMYMYLPAFGKERRIAASVKNQTFAGTDFSYDDMEPVPYTVKYSAQLVRSDGERFVVELIPRERSEYSKIVANINKTNFYPEVMEYYDMGGTKIKEAKYTFKKVGNYWSSEEIEMTDLKKNHTTRMQMSDVKYDTGLPDDEFTVRKLKQ
jgi:outer membrane lipoprotein-sorting protein